MESSLFLVGNTSWKNGPFSIAMLVYWSVILPHRDDSEIPSENNHGNGEYIEYPPNKMHECPPYQGTYCSKEISSQPTIHIQGIQLHHVSFQGGKIRTYLLCPSSSCSNISLASKRREWATERPQWEHTATLWVWTQFNGIPWKDAGCI